jgi:integrase/recombinase XerC
MDANVESLLDELIEIFAEYLQDQNRPPEAIPTDCAEVRRFWLWGSEHGFPPYNSMLVTRKDVLAYLKALQQTLPPAACNRALRALRSYFAFEYLLYAPEGNPTRSIPNLWDAEKAYSWLEAEEQRQLETAIDWQFEAPVDLVAWQANWVRAAALVRLLLHTGMHAVEARKLSLVDLQLGETRGVVQVRGKGERRLPLDSPTCAALRAWLAVRALQDDGEGWLWSEPNREAPHVLSVRGIGRACSRMAILAGLDPEIVSPRILRNTCAHNLLSAGESSRLVARLLRFKSVDSALRYR